MALTFTEGNFEEEVLKSDKPVLVDFWATWCGPCRMIAPIIDQLTGEFAGQAKIGKVDVDENNGLASTYNVRSIPTLIFFKNGQMVDAIQGATSKDVIVQKLNSLL